MVSCKGLTEPGTHCDALLLILGADGLRVANVVGEILDATQSAQSKQCVTRWNKLSPLFLKIDEDIPREARGECVTMFERTESMRKAFAHNTLLNGLLSSLQDSDKKQVLRKMLDQKVLPMKLALDPKMQFMTDKLLNSRGCLRAA